MDPHPPPIPQALLSLRLCEQNPTSTRPATRLVASALVATGARRCHLHPCRLRHANHRCPQLALSLRLCGPNPTGTTAFLEPNPTDIRTTAPRYRRASVDQIPPARGLQHLPSPRRWLHPHKQIPPAHALHPCPKSHRHTDDPVDQIPPARPAPPVTSALVASAEANPTDTRHRHLHPCRLHQAKSHRHTDDPSSFLLLSWSQIPPAHERPRLVSAAPMWTKSHRHPAPPVTSALVASAEANPTGTRRRHLHPCCLRQAKPHRHTADPSSFSLLSWSQIPPAHERPRLGIARLCGPNPTGMRPPAPPVTSALVAIQPAQSPSVNSAKLGTLETGHVFGGACAVCRKLGPAVGGKLGTLETGPVLAGNSAGTPHLPTSGVYTACCKHGTLQAEPLAILAPSRLDN